MRDYQRTTGKYILPRTLYHQTLWQIRDYYRLKSAAESILDASPAPPDGQPRGTDISNEVETKAQKRESYLDIIKVIDNNKESIPEEYRKGVWESIQFDSPYPLDAARSTYGMYKSRFVYGVARDLYLL